MPWLEQDDDLFNPDCSTRLVLDRTGDKWTVLVVLLPIAVSGD